MIRHRHRITTALHIQLSCECMCGLDLCIVYIPFMCLGFFNRIKS